MKYCSRCDQTKPFTAFHKRSYSNGYRSNCIECDRARKRAHYHANRESFLAYGRGFYEANKDICAELHSKWRAKNRAKLAVQQSYRRAAKHQATPPWADQQLIDTVYQKAEQYGLTVDHVVPLKSDLVCGLHVWENLQLLSHELNSSKKNRQWPGMEWEM